MWFEHKESKDCIMKNLLYAVLSLLVLSQTVFADDKKVAEELLKSKLDAIIEVIQKKELEPQERNKKIIEIVTPVFDFPLMAKLALGRKYWSGLSTEKKDKYSKHFTERLKESYLEKLYLYKNEKIIYGKSVQVKKKIHIPTDLISKSNKVSMLYKLYKSKNNWKIYDVEIQGVSIISTYRSQFHQVLNQGSIDDLLLKLEKPGNQ
jgi:phospholipid transport system substrate-binding protein